MIIENKYQAAIELVMGITTLSYSPCVLWIPANSKWLDRFRAHTDGQSAIAIGQRVTVAMRADIIHVIEAL